MKAAPLLACVTVLWLLGACAPSSVTQGGDAPTALAPEAPGLVVAGAAFQGHASWYGPGFAGRRTASGEVFDPDQLTAAHRTLPFGTRVRVTHLTNGRSVDVRITDRGPFIAGRVIDLSRGAAEAIGMLGSGVAEVRVEVLGSMAGAIRLAVAADLHGYDARSTRHQVGQLLLLVSERTSDPVLVRIVPGDPGSGADLFVAPELYLALGPVVQLRGE